jgi:transposase
LVDTLGLILAVVITAASVQDRDGGRRVLAQVPEAQYPELLTVFADAGYQGRLEEIALEEHALELVIVPKLEGQNTFVVLPRRWVVERTFAWLMRYRRLRADYETEPASSAAWIYVAAIHRMARRLAR